MTQQITGATPYFQVFDMTASVRFYRDVLGFEVVFATPEVGTKEGRFSHFVRLKLGDVDLMLNTAYDSDERPASRDDARWSGHRDVALYIDCADVDALYETLTGRGLKLAPPRIAPYGMKFIQVHDPDGYGLNFHMPA
jgi:uncharacterized glyoxalase superfamily protein PhnB